MLFPGSWQIPRLGAHVTTSGGASPVYLLPILFKSYGYIFFGTWSPLNPLLLGWLVGLVLSIPGFPR